MTETAETKTYRLSKRLSVDITVDPGGWYCIWDPAMPKQLTKKEKSRYRRARQEMFQRLADMTGETFVLADLVDDGEAEVVQVIQPLNAARPCPGSNAGTGRNP
jgi:hypothetical protein